MDNISELGLVSYNSSLLGHVFGVGGVVGEYVLQRAERVIEESAERLSEDAAKRLGYDSLQQMEDWKDYFQWRFRTQPQ